MTAVTVRKIRIISTPGGQAPEEIRQAWIGVEIPVDEKFDQPSEQATGGVLIRGDSSLPKRVYTVLAIDAFKALDLHNERALEWWLSNATSFFQEGRHLLFDESACELIA